MNSIYFHSEIKAVSSTNNKSNYNLLDCEKGQVEYFFSGLGTEVFVCSSLANLYEGTGTDEEWQLIFTGVPVILRDGGNTRSRTLPKVTLVLAERGSCFALWSDCIDHSSNYKVAGPSFHTMRLSSNNQQMVGLSFDSAGSANEFWQHMHRFVTELQSKILSMRRSKKFKRKCVNVAALPLKTQISNPCQFQHITSVSKEDSDRYYSMRAYTTLGER